MHFAVKHSFQKADIPNSFLKSVCRTVFDSGLPPLDIGPPGNIYFVYSPFRADHSGIEKKIYCTYKLNDQMA